MDGESVAHYGVHNIPIYRLQFSFSDPRGGEDCLILVIGSQVVVLVNLSVPKRSEKSLHPMVSLHVIPKWQYLHLLPM